MREEEFNIDTAHQNVLSTILVEDDDPAIKSFNKMPDSWPEPEAIRTSLLPVMPFDSDLLPEPLHDWIVDIAERMQCPVDFLAVAAIVVIASMIGAGCGVKPKQLDDWLVVPNLWGGVVGRPGTLKTPAVSEVMKLLGQLEAEAKVTFDTAMLDYKGQVEWHKTEKEAIKNEMLIANKQLLKNKGSPRHLPQTLKEQFLQLKEPEKPIWKRYKTNDATIEKLSELLADNPRGLLLYRDELIGLLASWDKEGHESDRAFFLEAWNGYGSLTTDRIGRGTTHTENLCLSVFGSTQPAKLTAYLHRAAQGQDNDGLLQRFQLLVYPDEPTLWHLIDRAPQQKAKERVTTLISALTQLDFISHGAIEEVGNDRPYFHFSPEAQPLFYTWLTELEKIKLQQEETDIFIEHLAKFRSLMPSLALIFHIIDLADGIKHTEGISASSTQRAIAWCDYLESHARRIYKLGVAGTNQATFKLAKKIQQGAVRNNFTAREVYRNQWTLLTDVALVHKACEALVEAQWLEPDTKHMKLPGRPAAIVYRINPKVFCSNKL